MKFNIILLFLLLAAVLFSCENEQNDNLKPEFNSSDTVKTVTVESFYIDENEVNSNEWKEFKVDSVASNSATKHIDHSP